MHEKDMRENISLVTMTFSPHSGMRAYSRSRTNK